MSIMDVPDAVKNVGPVYPSIEELPECRRDPRPISNSCDT